MAGFEFDLTFPTPSPLSVIVGRALASGEYLRSPGPVSWDRDSTSAEAAPMRAYFAGRFVGIAGQSLPVLAPGYKKSSAVRRSLLCSTTPAGLQCGLGIAAGIAQNERWRRPDAIQLAAAKVAVTSAILTNDEELPTLPGISPLVVNRF